jgi:hypothetical protein
VPKIAAKSVELPDDQRIAGTKRLQAGGASSRSSRLPEA